MKQLALFFFMCLFVSACEETIPDPEPVDPVESLLLDFWDEIPDCSNIVLVKTHDCLSCDLLSDKMFSDKDIASKSIFICENIRPIERERFIEERSYLIGQNVIYSDYLIIQMGLVTGLKFSTSTLIKINSKGDVVFQSFVREMVQKEDYMEIPCK